MLESTLFHKLLAWDVLERVRHAHREAEIDLGVGVVAGGAELEHVTEALLRAVHAGDAVIVVGDAGSLLVLVWRRWWKSV